MPVNVITKATERPLLAEVMSKTEQVQKAALIMIERYGDGALRQVDLRIEELWAHENEDARKLWVDIRLVVEALTKKPTNGRKH